MLITDEQLFLSQSYSGLCEQVMPKGMKPKVEVLVTKTIISRTFGDETLMVKAKAPQQENKSGSFNKTIFFFYIIYVTVRTAELYFSSLLKFHHHNDSCLLEQ